MTDPNQPSVPNGDAAVPAPEVPAAPQYAPAPPAADASGQAPAYGQQAYGQQPYGQQSYGAPVAEQKFNVLAIISLVTSLIGVSLAGIITGHIGLSQIKRTGEKGRGLALAGLIIGYVSIAASIIFIIVMIPFIIYALSHPEQYSTY